MWISTSIGDQVESFKQSAAHSGQILNTASTRSVQSCGAILSPNTISPGQIRNYVTDDVDLYNHLLSMQPSRLRKILYCQSGLSNNLSRSLFQSSPSGGAGSFQSSSSTTGNATTRPLINPKSIINHEFLVIVMKLGREEHCFLAEKCGAGDACGITVKIVPDAREFAGAVVSSFDCEDSRVSVERVMEIVEDHDPDYTVHEKNCWLYAVQTTKKLLIACENATGNPHFGDQAKLVGGRVTLQHIKDMAARGLRALADMLTSGGLGQ